MKRLGINILKNYVTYKSKYMTNLLVFTMHNYYIAQHSITYE